MNGTFRLGDRVRGRVVAGAPADRRLAAALIVFLLGVGGALSDDGEPPPWLKSQGDLVVGLVLTDAPEEDLQSWTEGRELRTPAIVEITRGSTIAALFPFSGCERAPNGNCELSVRLEMRRPDGGVQATVPWTRVWSGRPGPAKGEFEVAPGPVVGQVASDDPSGPYLVRATFRDEVGGAQIVIEREFLVREGEPPSNAPQDRPVTMTTAQFEKAIAPYVEQARRTLPDFKRRWLAGLPVGHNSSVVIRLSDPDGKSEQVFVQILSWQGEKLSGRVLSDLRNVRTHRQGEYVEFSEAEIYDWVIVRPDGTEEGNVVGKFLDTWHPTN